MKSTITLSLDSDVLNALTKAADERGLEVSSYIEYITMLYMVKNPTTAKRPAIKLSSKRGKEITDGFVAYLNEKLKAASDEYEWKYEINEASIADWLPPPLRQGRTYDDSRKLLDLCGQKLRESIETGDENLCFEAIRIAMDWGGVYYDYSRGVQRGNERVVSELFQNGMLLQTMSLNLNRIQAGDLENLDYFTSGWSIVWHIVDPETVAIMGPREIYAVNKILLAYMQKEGIEKLPAEIDFGQLVYKDNRRYLDGVKYVYTKKGKLKMLKKFISLVARVKSLHDIQNSFEIDKKLFILGE